MEEEMIATVKDELIRVIREVGLDPDVIKQKLKSCLCELLMELEIDEGHVRLMSRSITLGCLEAARETGSDPAFVGQYTAEGILEMIREYSDKSYEYITAAQDEAKEVFEKAADSSEEEEVAQALRKLVHTVNSMWPKRH